MNLPTCYLCSSDLSTVVFNFLKPDRFEKIMRIGGQGFFREWRSCDSCGLLYTNRSYIENLNSSLYEKKYRDPKVQGENIESKAKRILNLPIIESDSAMRAERLKISAERVGKMFFNWRPTKRKVLDIGAGLNIFLAKFQDSNWVATAVEVDQEACNYSEKHLGIKTICGTYDSHLIDEEKFDLITLNRVIEHTDDPIHLISSCKSNLKDNGLLYIEAPDAVTALVNNAKNRETFCSPHYMLFDPLTLSMVVKKSGFYILEIQRVLEPSGGFSINVLCCKSTVINKF